MKFLLLVCFVLVTVAALSQPIDSVRVIEADRETSFENYELLIIAVLGLLLLMGLRFWFRRTRKH
jgi:high-affinity nickel permease